MSTLGTAQERVEDAALLMGRGRYIDDMPVAPGTGHAAILRSPYAHARLVSIDTAAAEALPCVHAVVTGADARAWSTPFIVSVRQPMEHWCIATDRVRYAGEPVAIVVAEDRYRAEDALALIDVRYEPLDAIVDPEAALGADAPVLHEAVGSNLISERAFRYGEPEAAFEAAAHRVATTVRYPRNSCTPIECLGLIAAYDPGEDSYDVLSHFQGPLTLHPVMARALKVPGPRFRLRSVPDSGGSFGVKQAVFPYIVAMALAARKAARPVKWIEDRLEHLLAATSATNRVTRIEAAVAADGRVTALRLDQLEDCGAYLKAPEPATLYRNHGNLTGPYRIAHLAVTNRVVVTNKTPTGLNRGFGGPQLYYALERLMQRVAATLGLDPLEVIRRNLVPADAMPYRAAAGAVLDAGDFPETVEYGAAEGALDALRAKQAEARAEGRLYGIGYAAAVESSISNMGYITTVLSAEERRKAGPKDGAVSHATVAVDPLGAVTVTADSIPQGQGHRTVLAQVVGDALGLAPEQVTVALEHDTQRDPWSIAAGNYSSRFSGAVAGTAHLAAVQVRERLARIASQQLNAPFEDVRFEKGRIFAVGNPGNDLDFRRVASLAHWSPGSLPEGVPPALRECRPLRGLDAAGAHAAGRRRPGQQLGSLQLHLRFLRGGGRPGDRRRRDRPLRHHPRRRAAPQPGAGGRPDSGRLRPCRGRGVLRGARLRRGRRLPLRHPRRLPGADRLRGARPAHPAPRHPEPGDAARRQGSGRRQLHDHARLPRQRRGRRAGCGEPRSAAHACAHLAP